MEVEVLSLAQTARQFTNDLPVYARLSRRIDGLIIFDYSSLEAGDGPFILGPYRSWQHDIGQFSGFGEEEVCYHEEVQSSQCSLNCVLVGQGDHWIRANHK